MKLDCLTDIGDPNLAARRQKPTGHGWNLALALRSDQNLFAFPILQIGGDAALTRMLEMDG